MGQCNQCFVSCSNSVSFRFLTLAFILLMSAIPIASIAIGVVYLDSCPAQKLIPIYLIVSGSIFLFFLFASFIPCGNEDEPSQTWTPSGVCCGILMLFQFCWFIAVGNVWIYSIYQPDYISTMSLRYCHRVLYLYAFWITTLVYILVGALILISLCMGVIFC
uniref:Uncharacterized protein n=1 Tax=Latimeria chalumnae TaxID=7897 RepID=H2ZX55_LATCH